MSRPKRQGNKHRLQFDVSDQEVELLRVLQAGGEHASMAEAFRAALHKYRWVQSVWARGAKIFIQEPGEDRPREVVFVF